MGVGYYRYTYPYGDWEFMKIKRLFLTLLAALALPTAANANSFIKDALNNAYQ